MFWDRVAVVYDVFVNVINKKTHKKLKNIVSELVDSGDIVLECACGTGLLSGVIAPKCNHLTATDFSDGAIPGTRMTRIMNFILNATNAYMRRS